MVVQTAVLADAIGTEVSAKKTSKTDDAARAKYKAYEYMAWALEASERIPHELGPAEAAEEFCRWQLGDGEKPDWF